MRCQVRIRFSSKYTVMMWVSMFVLSASIASADGFFIPAPARRVPTIPSQRALLTHHNGEENLIIQSAFKTDGGSDFGWIIPLPATPTRFKAVEDDLILDALSIETKPSIITQNDIFWLVLPLAIGLLAIAALFLACKGLPFRVLAGLLLANLILALYLWSSPENYLRARASSSPAMTAALPPRMTAVKGVAVEASEKVGNYDVVSLKADGAPALDEWLASNGYMKLPTAAHQTVEDLAREHWRFVAARLHLENTANGKTMQPHPIMLTFPTPRLIYPMRLTAHAGSNLDLELFIVADRRAECSPLRLEYCGDFSNGQIKSESDPPPRDGMNSSKDAYRPADPNSLANLFPQLTFWPGCVLTRLGGVVAPGQMKTDYTFTLKRAKEFRLTLHTRKGAIERAGGWTLGLWSLGMVVMLVVFSFKTGYQPFAFVLLRRNPDQPNRRRACFRACLALSIGALTLYWGMESSLTQLRPGETVIGGGHLSTSRIEQYFLSTKTHPGQAPPPLRRDKARRKPAKIDLSMRFRDKETGIPLTEVKACLTQFEGAFTTFAFHKDIETACQEKPDTLRFLKTDRSGQAIVSSFKLADYTLEREMDSKNVMLYLVAVAPGYVRQTFQIPIEQARSGKELVFEMGTEAQVQGRVLLAETGEPLNKTTVRALLERKGIWARLLKQNHGYEPSINPQISMRNWTIEENRLNYKDPSFMEFFRVPIGPDGRFEFKGLQPHKAWICEMELEGLPKFIRYNVALKPGMNDLGNLQVRVAGELHGKIVDEKGKGVKGAYVQFPIEGLGSDIHRVQTSTAGVFNFDLTSFTHDRQIMRITPLWGIDPADGVDESGQEHLVYEAIMPLDRTSSHTLTTRIDRGHTLLIEIPPSAIRDKAVKFYRDSRNRLFEEISRLESKGFERFFAVSGATIQSLDANKEGFVYHRSRQVHEGQKFTSGTMLLRVDHVPPGRHALRLDGGFYVTEPATKYEPRRVVEWRGHARILDEIPAQPPKIHMVDDTIPLAFTEFEMKATTTTLRLELSPTDLELDLSGRPHDGKSEKELNTLVFLERKQPLSTVYADELRRVLLREDKWIDGDDMESRRMPMMGYSAFFSFKDPATQRQHYRPRQIPAVPPGIYRLQAFTGVEDFQKVTPAKPYYETDIQVSGDGKKILVSVPYQVGEALQ